MGNGWIKLHRKLLTSLIFGNEKALKIWIWCLLKARHSEDSFLLGRTRITLQAGQFVMGSNKGVEQLGIAKATIWYWLNFLEKEKQVRLQKNAKYTVVTILNWEQYQHTLDAGETLASPIMERQVGTYKNEKNVKNEEEVIYAAPANEILLIQEHKNGKPFPNRKRQLGAIGRMLAADYSPEDIERCWEWMGRDSFWGEKGFDFENVANQIGKAKAQVADFKSFAKKK